MQIEIMQGLYGWVNALARAAQNRRAARTDEAFTDCVRCAVNALERAIEARKAALYGRFVHWYDGDRLMNLRDCVNRTKALVSVIEASER